MAPVINKDLAAKVKSLTKAQLTDIFTAKVTNWKQVGGPDEPIVLITRPATSGTRALFQEFALGGAKEATNKSLETDDSGTLLQSVKDNKGAIGYVALSYLVNNKDVATVAIDGGMNAAILAAKMLAMSDPELLEKLKAYSAEMKDTVQAKADRLAEVGYEEYLNNK